MRKKYHAKPLPKMYFSRLPKLFDFLFEPKMTTGALTVTSEETAHASDTDRDRTYEHRQ
ncbi:MAG: hypothetical protein Rhims3KO_35840 [Hyphomicrobiales bacterium]